MIDQFLYKTHNGARALRRWIIPYLESRLHPNEFRPVLCYLFTDWKCNVDCHYCFQYDNSQPGMTWETAMSSIEWLRSLGCRVLPIMGGEPLIRKEFALDVIRYASQRGFFVYLPTNGRLMDKNFIDGMGEAGVAAINLAVDCVEPTYGLPKNLSRIKPQFEYLVEQQEKYGYLVFLNTNICRNNIADAKKLTEIAHEYHIGTDYHLNEKPHPFVGVDHYKHREDGLHILPEQYGEVDDLLDWLIERQREHWPMVNSIAHLQAFKARMRGKTPEWNCLAGQNAALIRTDGSLSPCFDVITYYDHDWGTIWDPKFYDDDLRELKSRCLPYCSSTCFYTLGHYFNPRNMPQWIRKHVLVG